MPLRWDDVKRPNPCRRSPAKSGGRLGSIFCNRYRVSTFKLMPLVLVLIRQVKVSITIVKSTQPGLLLSPL